MPPALRPPPGWREGDIKFVDKKGNPTPKNVFSPKSYLPIPGEDIEGMVWG